MTSQFSLAIFRLIRREENKCASYLSAKQAFLLASHFDCFFSRQSQLRARRASFAAKSRKPTTLAAAHQLPPIQLNCLRKWFGNSKPTESRLIASYQPGLRSFWSPLLWDKSVMASIFFKVCVALVLNEMNHLFRV